MCSQFTGRPQKSMSSTQLSFRASFLFKGNSRPAGSDRAFTQHRVTRGRYRFSIQGCTKGIPHSNCSDWVVTDILVPPELGFQPWRRPFPIAPGGFAHRGAVTAVARTPDHLDVFWVGADGNISTTFWHKGQNWAAPFPIAPKGFASPGAVTAVARTPDQLDVFWVGADGNDTTFWHKGQNWAAPFPIAPKGFARKAR